MIICHKTKIDSVRPIDSNVFQLCGKIILSFPVTFIAAVIAPRRCLWQMPNIESENIAILFSNIMVPSPIEKW
jgi:hypothetical protein